MFDLSYLLISSSVFILILIFWLLTFIFSFFFIKYENNVKFDYYECGFKSMSDLNFSLNISIITIMLFIILYDIELLFLLPYLLCFDYCDFIYTNTFYFLLFSIFYTFIIDIYEDIFEWNF